MVFQTELINQCTIYSINENLSFSERHSIKSQILKIKGWKKYLEWNTPSEKGIQEQAEYDLKGKLETSEEICVAISGQHNIFRQIPEVFILVTDIDVSEQGVENFHFNMMALATTSSVWESKCNTELNSQLEQQITTIPKYYVTCKQLENKLNVISRV